MINVYAFLINEYGNNLKNKTMKTAKTLIATILTILSLSIFVVVIVKNITLKQNCTGYLQRAANASTVEIASIQLAEAIAYLEENNMTSGYTSVLWKTPDEDIGFWYNNIKEIQSELLKVDSSATSLEKTNLLMKLREALMDNGDEGDKLIVPAGLSRYPNNLLYGILRLLGGFIIVFLSACGLIKLYNL